MGGKLYLKAWLKVKHFALGAKLGDKWVKNVFFQK